MVDTFKNLAGDHQFAITNNNVASLAELDRRMSEVEADKINIKLLVLYRHLISGTYYRVLTLL